MSISILPITPGCPILKMAHSYPGTCKLPISSIWASVCSIRSVTLYSSYQNAHPEMASSIRINNVTHGGRSQINFRRLRKPSEMSAGILQNLHHSAKQRTRTNSQDNKGLYQGETVEALTQVSMHFPSCKGDWRKRLTKINNNWRKLLYRPENIGWSLPWCSLNKQISN